MVTALSNQKNIDQAKELGADDYIIKPYESRELIKKIAAIISKK